MNDATQVRLTLLFPPALEDRVIALILEHPAIMKRPVLDAGGRSVVGFTPDRYEAFLG